MIAQVDLDGVWVGEGGAAARGNRDEIPPGLAVVCAPAHDQIIAAAIAASRIPLLCKGQECALLEANDGRNAIAVFAGHSR